MDKKYLIFVIIISLVFLCFCQYTNIKYKKSTESFTASNQINISDDQKLLLKNFIEKDINDIPAGIIVSINSDNIPEGWVRCDGTEVWYDNKNLKKHTTPDLRGRFLLGSGQGPNLTARVLNATGGSETHTLTTDQLPGHTHTGKTGIKGLDGKYENDGSHTHDYQKPNDKGATGCGTGAWYQDHPDWFYENTKEETLSGGNHQHAFTTDSTGEGNDFSIMPPFHVVNYIIKSDIMDSSLAYTNA